MANGDDNLVLRHLREIRADIGVLRLETQQSIVAVKDDVAAVRRDVVILSETALATRTDIRELSLQTGLLEVRMGKVMEHLDKQDQRITALSKLNSEQSSLP
jgi:hypothetical protein